MTSKLYSTFDYSRPLCKETAIVALIDKLKAYSSLAEDIAKAGDRYGFSFVDLDRDSEPNLNDFLVRHLLIVDGHDDPAIVTLNYESTLSQYTSATIAVRYSNYEKMMLASPIVDKLKRETGGRINYLLPSVAPDGYVPSLQKLVDNSICDSVRIKYRPLCRGSLSPADLPSDVSAFFSGVSDLIARYKIYHRAPTDGFISVRSADGGFFITCTRTDKCELSLRRIAHVRSYSAKSNLLEFSGNYLPSSDSVEAAIVYERQPWVQAIIHTHASTMFTRNPKYRHKIAIPPSTYGQAGLGEDIADYLSRTKTRDFVILEDHGEFIFGTSSQLTESLDQVCRLVANA